MVTTYLSSYKQFLQTHRQPTIFLGYSRAMDPIQEKSQGFDWSAHHYRPSYLCHDKTYSSPRHSTDQIQRIHYGMQDRKCWNTTLEKSWTLA
jgi:hypothetical protein